MRLPQPSIVLLLAVVGGLFALPAEAPPPFPNRGWANAEHDLVGYYDDLGDIADLPLLSDFQQPTAQSSASQAAAAVPLSHQPPAGYGHWQPAVDPSYHRFDAYAPTNDALGLSAYHPMNHAYSQADVGPSHYQRAHPDYGQAADHSYFHGTPAPWSADVEGPEGARSAHSQTMPSSPPPDEVSSTTAHDHDPTSHQDDEQPLTVDTWIPAHLIRRAALHPAFGDSVLFEAVQTGLKERLRPSRVVLAVRRRVAPRVRRKEQDVWLFRNLETPTHTVIFFRDLVLRAFLQEHQLAHIRTFTAFAIPRRSTHNMVFVGQVHVNEVVSGKQEPRGRIEAVPGTSTWAVRS
ncbi:uncharacterized protein PFL1_04673 [Pseudozyma flocculosa PF-1]|uniref:Uncharacterized protein n=1 Tax=Pseudozyma flocculosa PF-1 TaxID=1277687 RepID=A0A061H631_9BASI|nr:uncharacterized protein PFL1_04673 [Pseudozyma flocculosa PF-1]EPQ27929.1 hypothetical protein PFL1_04673 [Pseudozyma flocculosa PF-1]